MNRKVFLITALIFLLIGISAVSAEDINQTADSLEITDSDAISADEPTTKSFTDLNQAVDVSTDNLNIESDYKFNSSTDGNFTEGIKINIHPQGTYTINGNNHVIDADNKAGVFVFTNGKVIMNNLKIANANRSSIILDGCDLYTNNVTFENCYDSGEGAAVFAGNSLYSSNHDKFINNYAKTGSSIFLTSSNLEINNSTFISNKTMQWSLIYGIKSIMSINNTIFTNMTSRYATAIYGEESKLIVLNSKFINLSATATAGAIGGKELPSILIDRCSFINVTSIKNAGAVYVDNGEKNITNYSATLSNSLFENCSSNFGGAYLQLGGQLNIVRSNFIGNVAEYMGGAIYTSSSSVLIGSSKFNKNTARQLYGGAVYIDNANSIITACDFVENIAGTYGSAIYLYDSKYEIKNSYFSKNGNDTIISFFDRKDSSLSNNDLNGAKISMNNERYNTIVQYEGKQINLDQQYIITNASASSPRFDLRDYIVNGVSLAGVVKDQGSNGACWAFGATGALESAFLKATGILLDLSENNIQGAAGRYSEFGDISISEAGFVNSAMGLFLAWLSVINTTYDTYDELGKISIASFAINESYHIQDVIIIPPRKQMDNTKLLKDALVKYGGLTVHILGASANNKYYNPTTHAQYCDNKTAYGNHFVTLVGWDDNYPKENFNITPPGNGAWICKNSWGTEWGENGFFYVSYYDTTFAMNPDSIGYIISNDKNYTSVYQYDMQFDGYFKDNGKDITFINTYVARDDELISAVGTYFENAGDKYTITIFVDDCEVYTQSGTSTHAGFETIKLNKMIAVNAGHKFSAQVQSKALPLVEASRVHFEVGNSIVFYSKGKEDLAKTDKTACIKVYTISNPNPEKGKSQYYNKNSNITVASNADGKTITIIDAKGKILGSAIVKDGFAKFDFNLEPGKYSIITTYDYGDVAVPFEVKNTIIVAEAAKIGYNTNLLMDATFYDADGVELFNREITISLDGKTTTLKIDNNKGTLNLVLYDLSIGKHTLVLLNPETLEESTSIITVVSRFSGNSNVNMFYADGSSFKVRIYGNNGNPVGANQVVTMKLNKATYKVKTNGQGYAILNIPNTVKPGTYTLTATYAGQTIKNTVKVKQVLKLAKVKVKKSAKKLVIKATLKGKKVLKGIKLTFKFNGKKYTAKTNKKGVAQITIKKSVLKKLKVGKKVKYQVTYLKNTVTQTVKVKR